MRRFVKLLLRFHPKSLSEFLERTEIYKKKNLRLQVDCSKNSSKISFSSENSAKGHSSFPPNNPLDIFLNCSLGTASKISRKILSGFVQSLKNLFLKLIKKSTTNFSEKFSRKFLSEFLRQFIENVPIHARTPP